MAITVFPDVIMPTSVIAAGVRGKNMRNNTRTMNQGGFGNINANWSKTLRQFDLGFVPMLASIWQTIEGLHEVTQGGAYGFLMEDPKDSAVALSEGILQPYTTAAVGTAGFGWGVPSYQLYKRYAAIGTAQVSSRLITRPKLPLAQLQRAGVAVTLGAAPGNAAVSGYTVTFVADATASVTAVTVGASTQVTLGAGIGLVNGNRLWLQGLTGADAALLNNQSHPITGLAGNVYTLGTNTAGKTITPAGQGHKYPQFSESLTWSGGFYVPVNFMADDLDWEIVRSGPLDQRLIMGQSIVLQEIRE